MIRVEALGGLRIFVGDQESASLAKQRLKCALVVFLAVERSALRESVLNTFWPDREPERARHALSQTLYELRKILGDDWLSVTGDRMTVAEHVRCDVVDFITAVDSGEIQSALRAYGGSFLANCYLAETREFEEWSDRRQERVTKLLRRALREASQLEETPPWVDDAIEAAHRAAEQSPTDDDVQHALLQLLVRAGRRSDALAQYERYQAALVEDKLEPLEHTKQLIATIRDSAETPAPPRLFSMPERSYEPPQTDAQQQPAPKPETKFPIKTTLGVLLLLATAALVPWLITNSGNGQASKASDPPSIAVLYFDDLSPHDSLQFLSNALTEGLIDEFSRVQGLDVRSKAAVKYYAGRQIPPDSIERGLDVDFLIDGSTEMIGETVQVIVQLVDVATGNNLESEPLQRPFSAWQELRNDVVQEVAVLFRRKLGQRLEVRRRSIETRSRHAFDNYWKAKREVGDATELLLKRDGADAARAALVRADSLLEGAERNDRSWAAPIVLRGQVASLHAQVAMHHGGPEAFSLIRETLDRAITHANRALAVDRDNAEALELRGVMKYRIWFTGTIRDSAEFRLIRDSAESDLRLAVDKDSLRVEAWSTLAELHNQNGNFNQAEIAARTAYDLDRYYSRALETLFRLALSTFEQGREEEAARWCSEGERRFPQSHQFIDCRLRPLAWGTAAPDVDSAQALLQRVAQLHPSAPGQDASTLFRLMAASVYARAGLPSEAAALLEGARSNPDPSFLWVEAAARARLNQPDRAIALVERFVEAVPWLRHQVVNSRALEPLRANPRFEKLRNSKN